MSTENHDQPAAPEGSAPAAPETATPAPGASPAERSAETAPSAASPAQASGPAQPSARELPQPVQTVSAPHPQAHATQELHPQQQATAPYPAQSYGTHRPQPQYGQYAAPAQHHGQGQQAPGHHAPYVHPSQARTPYPQQGVAQQPSPGPHAPSSQAPSSQAPGAAFGNPYAVASGGQSGQQGGPGDPGEPGGRRERKPRGWVPVVSAAAIAAVLASGGTAAVVTSLQDDGRPASISQIGDPGRVDAAPVTESTVTNPDWQAVTAAVQQSVVSIATRTAQGGGEGSGLILDEEGHVLTNNHVVAGAQNDVVQVTLADGRLFKADIVGTDPTTDLAVVKLQNPPSGLRPVALGNSDQLAVGEPVLAVGNPLGLANTATTGIISALDRPVSASGENTQTPVTTNAIQIDAAINPGNSGGPLFNAQGQVIGITSSIASLSGGSPLGGQSGSIGLGFAIPVNLAKNISSQLIENGSAQHAFIGVTMTDGTATADGVTRRGGQVQDVVAGSPAADAGIQAGDVIVAIGDQPVSSASALTAFVREYQAGQEVTLTLVRGGNAQQVDVTLAVRDEATQQQPQQPQEPQEPEQGDQPDQGSSDGNGLWDWLFGN